MHADDTNYTVIKNGIVVVSGTGPAIRVDSNRLVIRDGPQETPPLLLTRAEASRKLRHIVVCGHAGGFVTFDALRWLRDTGVAFSQLDWDGAVVIASGPRGPDRPVLRRTQALVCSGVIPKSAVAISREILRVKLKGQAEVLKLMGSEEASAAIGSLAATIARETEGAKLLAIEARAASIYWKEWEDVPVRFARRNPQRLGTNGRWRPGRPDPWLTFGPRASLLTGKPWRATTPGNALLNFLYALLESEMTVALLAVGLDPGIGMFHADVDGRSSLAFDAIEAARPYVDCWLLAYFASSVFANRDFAELSDGEVRMVPPLNAHLAHTAALWRKACEPVAYWLAQAFGRTAGGASTVLTADDRIIGASQHLPARVLEEDQLFPPLAQPLRSFLAPGQAWLPAFRRAARLNEDPVPRACAECGRALPSGRRKFCIDECVASYHSETPWKAVVVATAIRYADPEHSRVTKLAIGKAATRNAERRLEWRSRFKGLAIDEEALRRWYNAAVLPALSRYELRTIMECTGLSKQSAILIRSGRRIPHLLHVPALAKLAGIELPKGLLPAPAETGVESHLERG
jgi:CRISPR-associated endonuclease Cas1